MARPWRKISAQFVRRWRNHALLLAFSSAAAMLVYRGGAVMTALAMRHNPWGLLNHAWLPLWTRYLLAIGLLDLVRYGLHRSYHSVSVLWRFHQVHHSDTDYDLSTGLRSHPIEGLVGQGGYLLAIAALAAPPGAVLAAELLSLFQTFFSHANAALPEWIEKTLRLVFITPEMHRVHHSQEVPEQNSNLGDVFPWWDRLLGTYVASPAAGLDAMRIGMKGVSPDASARLAFMLMQPFRRADF
jgi:sterol desaturase/sphingolipid hydroxylase (fatty acid hydroxylase superfamily)